MPRSSRGTYPSLQCKWHLYKFLVNKDIDINLNLNTDFVLCTPSQDFTGADSFILNVNDGNSNNKSGKSRDFQTG
jgi:hypothetical protein